MATEIISEDWLLEHLPAGWTYDCTFEPEPAFLIYASEGGAAPRYGPLRLPLRLLAADDQRERFYRALTEIVFSGVQPGCTIAAEALLSRETHD